jgi:4-hydroxybenzoate polyprenyltransferase
VKVAKAIRPHQWAKNLLIFVPLALAHRITDVNAWISALLAFAAFSLCASSVYVVNDLFDIDADRHHPKKRLRPFASGALSIRTGLALAPALLVGAAIVCVFTPRAFVVVLAGYFAATLVYSLVLKRVAIVDVLLLAGLYTVRIVAGAAATGVVVSSWLETFSLFIFLNLALVKRYTELHALAERGETATKGRGYSVVDRAQVASLGSAAGYVAVLVLALYITSNDVVRLYQHPRVLWALLPLILYWTSRVWLLTGRGEMHDDPVVFAVKDRTSYVVALLSCVVVYFAV